MMYEYIFQNSKGESFSMYACTTHAVIDATVTSFYDSIVFDNYVKSRIDRQYDKIKTLFDSSKLKYEFKVLNKYYYTIDFYLKNTNEIEKLCDTLYEFGQLIDLEKSLNTDSNAYKISDYVRVYFNLEPIKNIEYTNSSCASYDLKYGSEKKDMMKSIQQDLLSHIYENGGKNKDNFDLSNINMYDFKVNKAIYEPEQFKTITFYYDESIDDYYTSDIGICLNYDLYNYNHNDLLEVLVKKLGGTFRKDGWTSTCSIGSNTWNATLLVDSKDNYKDLIIKKNDKKIDLKYCMKYENSIFQQHFAVQTLEQMLNANIYISQTGVVTITKK